MSTEAELQAEQRYVDVLYGRLDELRQRTERALAAVRRSGPAGTPANRSERDAFATLHEARLSQLEAVEDRLAFGRLDLTDGTRRYIGRIGLSDDDQRQLLLDWRAPAARGFYQATAAEPGDLVRRRHLSTNGRTVTAVEDDVLDLDALGSEERRTLSGEGALLAAVGAARTGRMGDIVATIQAEQDQVIRSDLAGALVVQGGPGTGKTAVALHRAAYLLYTHRQRLERSGVLLVGPSPVFLRYVSQVLPSLGETGVVMSSLGELMPGVHAVADDDPAAVALKGDLRMVEVLRAAVRARQRVPSAPRRLQVAGATLELTPGAVGAARARARGAGKPHNRARRGFALDLLDHLAHRLAAALGASLDADLREDLLADLRDSSDVRREVNLAWMPLTPQQLLADLWAEPHRLVEAAPHLSDTEHAVLRRERSAPWTVADVPLLDEAAELLGEDDAPAREAARREAVERAQEVSYAAAALASSGAGGLVSAETLAGRFAGGGPSLTVAERAAHDRTWTYGHVVVDEAQELSPMAWRLLMRRCPSRSMTLVGDIAQTGSAAGATSWAEVLDPYAAGRWRLTELTVNYRTPASILRLAAGVLAAAGITVAAPQSVREGAERPRIHRIAAGDGEVLAAAVRREVQRLGAGRLAVLTAAPAHAAVAETLNAALPAGTVGTGADALDHPVAVLAVGEAKGLEFDVVVVVEPGAIVAGSPRGVNDLYVALTRPTQRLLVLHSGELPPGLFEASRSTTRMP